LSIGKANGLGLDDQLAGAFGLLNLQVDIAGFAAARLVGGAHLLQAAHAPLVSGAAGLYPLSDPGFLLG